VESFLETPGQTPESPVQGEQTTQTVSAGNVERDIEHNTARPAEGDPPRCPEHLEKKRIHASIAAVLILSAPFTIVSLAIWCFLTGLCIYLAFLWRNDLETEFGKDDSRNVFIFTLVGLGLIS
jgi:hypothetical protein